MSKELDQEKLKALEKFQTDMDKEMGKGTIFFGDDTPLMDVPVWPLSSPNLTYVFGRGLPKGRIIEIYGPESSGKTTVATIIAADVQEQGGVVGFVDAEHAFDKAYAKELGLDTSVHSFIFSQPDSGEDSLTVVERMIKTQAIDLIIVDSVAALTPQAEIDGEMGASHMGLQARLMSQGMRKLNAVASSNNVSLIFINQIRMKIGVMYGNPETTTGGNALKFYSSIRLETRKVKAIEEGPSTNPDTIGQTVRLKVVKNKVAPPFRKVESNLYFRKGFDTVQEYLDFGVTYGIVDKSGSWYSYKNERLGQGKENSANMLRENKSMFDEIKLKVNDEMLRKFSPVPEEPKAEESTPKRKSKKEKEEVVEGSTDSVDSKIE